MQTLNDLQGKVSLNNPYLYFIYIDIATHVTFQSSKFNKPFQVLGANTESSKQTQLL